MVVVADHLFIIHIHSVCILYQYFAIVAQQSRTYNFDNMNTDDNESVNNQMREIVKLYNSAYVNAGTFNYKDKMVVPEGTHNPRRPVKR